MVGVRMYRKQICPYKKVLERFYLFGYFMNILSEWNFRVIASRENFMSERFILSLKDILPTAVAWVAKYLFDVFNR